MKDSEKLGAGQDSNEVELSAQDLLAMSPQGVEAPAGSAPMAGVDATDEAESDTPRDSQRAPRARRISAAAIMLTVGVAVAAAAVAVIVPKERESEPAPVALAPPSPPAVEESAPAEVEGPLVRFKNPFDETEVFEFPPGTSREEARAAVADLLIMRAQERQALLETRSKERS